MCPIVTQHHRIMSFLLINTAGDVLQLILFLYLTKTNPRFLISAYFINVIDRHIIMVLW